MRGRFPRVLLQDFTKFHFSGVADDPTDIGKLGKLMPLDLGLTPDQSNPRPRIKTIDLLNQTPGIGVAVLRDRTCVNDHDVRRRLKINNIILTRGKTMLNGRCLCLVQPASQSIE